MKTFEVGQEVVVNKNKGTVILDTGFFVKVQLDNGVVQMTEKKNVKEGTA